MSDSRILESTEGDFGLSSEEAVATQPPAVSISGLVKTYVRSGTGDKVHAVDNVSLEIAAEGFTVLLGPSGCGKTTLLRCIAGLERPDSGEVCLFGKTAFNSSERISIPPERRDIGMMFQSYALWPHLTAFDNIAYPLRRRGVRKSETTARVEEVAAKVGVAHLLAQHPGKLSGGQQQRIALARALVAEPSLILFDEPLSNVDAKVREELRTELIVMQRTVGFTAVYVAHDQSEALDLADTIAVLDEGRVDQLGSPSSVYSQPASRHVARFIGSSNEVTGTVLAVDGETVTVRTPIGLLRANGSADLGDEVSLIWRPESCALLRGESRGGAEANFIPVHVESTQLVGPTASAVCEAQGTPLRVVGESVRDVVVGASVHLQVPVSALWVFPYVG